MNVDKICQRNVVTLQRSDEVITAARIMRERHIGYIVVVEPGTSGGSPRPVGVLTDRDIVITVVARETDARSLRVGEIMTAPPVTVSIAEPLDKALHEMRHAGVRRLPVVGMGGELVGILSLDDVLAALAGQLQDVAGSVRNERLIEGTLRP